MGSGMRAALAAYQDRAKRSGTVQAAARLFGVMRTVLIPAFALALSACVTAGDAAPSPEAGLTYARFGQSVNLGGPRVRPLSLIEDSRCPMNARCVWAGQVRITAEIVTGRGRERRELTLGRPVPVADGVLELTDVRPPRKTGSTIPPRAYRLGLRFSGGL
jgi:hypothetical protein